MKDDSKTKKQLIDELAELHSQNAALKKSENTEKYRSLVENIRDVIYELDSQGVVLYISPAVKDLLGYDSAEIVGKNFIDLAHKDDLSRRAEWFSELRKGIEAPFEYRVINKAGEPRWARTTTRPIMEDGLFKGARGILLDITEQRRVEEALRESEELFRSYLENAPDAVYMSDLEGNFIYGNLKCEAIIGYRREELIGKNFLEVNILPEKSMNKAAQLLQANIEGKSTGPDEIELISKEGRIIPAEITTSVVQRMGQVIILGFVRNITNRRKAEEKMKRTNIFLDSIIENIPNMIFLKDARELRFIRFNRAGEELLGYSRNDLLGKNDYDFFSKEQADHFTKKDREVLSGKKVIDIPEEPLQTLHKGERIIHTKKVPLLNEKGEPEFLLGISEDITEAKQAEAKLRQQTDAMDAAIDGMAILNETGEYVYVNKAHARLYGYENAGELIGKPWKILYDPEVLRYFEQEVMPELSRKGDWHGEAIGTKKNGSKFPQELSLAATANGGLICVVRDITDRKRADSETQAMARFPSENPSPILRVALDGTLLYANEACLSQLPDWHPNVGQGVPPMIRDVVTEAMTSGKTRLLDLEHRRQVYSFFVAPIADAGYANMYGRDITDRKRAEEALREGEEKYRWALDNMADVITVMDMNLRFTYVSPSIMRMRGYTAEEAVAQTFEQVMTPESLQISLKVFEEEMKLEAGGTADPDRIRIVELEQYRKDGSIVLVENHLSFMRDEAKKAVAVISVSSDITTRKQVENALKESENKYRLLADNANDIIFALDMNLKQTYVSPSVKTLRGYEPEEALKQQASEILTPPSLDLAMSTLSEIMELEKQNSLDRQASRTLELEMIRKDGTTVWTEVKFSFIRDENQHPMGILGLTRDITERKQAEEELRKSEERFRRIFDEGPVGLGIESPDHTIIAANKVLCELLGYTEQELVGQNTTDIVHEEDREKRRESLEQLFANGTPMFRQENRYVRKDGTILWANTSISPIHGQDGNVLYGLAIIEDLTEGKKAAEKIHRLAYYDSLTGLPNRTFHEELMKRTIEHAQRHKEIFALICIGLDNFQRINDTLGHSTGDLLLKAVADRLNNALRKSDYVARLDEHETVNVVSRVGGDEFVVLAHDLNQAQDAAKSSRRLLAEMSTPYELNGHEVFLTASIGIALYPDDGTDVYGLLKNAEKAMRHTKSEGKNGYHFYSSSMHSSVLGLLTMESDLHKALERHELVLYYQPKVDAATRRVKGMEALIRWNHPDKGLVPPMQFIPLAETSGLILPIGEFVIRTVCKQIKTWQEAGYQQVNIALNVSGRQFDQQNLMEIVKEALQDTMIPPQCLELEITESTIMRNPEKAIRILTELNALGIAISIDDFGTGYSSLSYLKRLPLNFLKIDQSFVNGLASDPKDQAIVRAMIAMAHSLSLKTIAEGVETQEQLSFLQENGCDEIQGYLFSRPVPAEEIPGILAKGYL